MVLKIYHRVMSRDVIVCLGRARHECAAAAPRSHHSRYRARRKHTLAVTRHPQHSPLSSLTDSISCFGTHWNLRLSQRTEIAFDNAKGYFSHHGKKRWSDYVLVQRINSERVFVIVPVYLIMCLFYGVACSKNSVNYFCKLIVN